MVRTEYTIGDVVFFSLSGHTVAGEATFIGHPKAEETHKILVLVTSAEVDVEIGADECSPTGQSNPQRRREYRQRYFRDHPRGLEGNP